MQRSHPAFLACVSVLAAGLSGGQPGSAAVAPLVDVRSVAPEIRIDLRYNSPNNPFRQRLYSSNTALLRKSVARRLARVQSRLEKQGLGLKIWDAYRPTSVQYRMWKLRPDGRKLYIANPAKGSKHSRGAAVDVTLVTRAGVELKMPTPHDEFSRRAHRNAVQGVTPLARKNSRILEAAMRAEGFVPNPFEWWHFSDPEWRRYPLADEPLPKAPRKPLRRMFRTFPLFRIV